MKKFNIKGAFRRIIISSVSLLIIIIPLYLVVINSFKERREASLMGLGFPSQWNIAENYLTVIRESNFLTSLFNSALYVVTVIPTLLIVAGMAGWIFARIKSKITEITYYAILLGLLVPPSVIATLKVLQVLSIDGTRAGLILFYIGALLPFTIFFSTGFIKTIPVELEEAARIDGCNNFQIFFRIIFPLLKPVFATVSVFIGIRVWNDFMWPFYILRGTSQFNLVLGLYRFIGGYENVPNIHLIFADVIVVSLPLILFYVVAQKFIIGGIMGGAVKQ